jgi:transcription termination/antitermination protein NusA
MLLNTRDLQLMSAFEDITKSRVSDCFEFEDVIAFIVEKGELGKAIGKGGANIAEARKKLRKRIAVFEDSENPREFIEKACSPVKVSVMVTENYVKIDAPRGQRDDIAGKQIRLIKELVKRRLKVDRIDFTFV